MFLTVIHLPMASISKKLYCQFFIVFFFITSQTLVGQPIQKLPKLSGRVVDNLGLLTPKQKSSLANKLKVLDQKTGAEVVLVIVPSTKPESIEGYSMRLAKKWKPGKKGADNGVVVLIAKNDRKLRIEVGYGLEGILTDARCRQIISKQIVPHFKKADFYGGIRSGIDRLVYILENREGIESEEALAKEVALVKAAANEKKWKRWRLVKDFSYFWLIPCGFLGIFLIIKKYGYLGFFLPASLYGFPILLLGLFFDPYFLDALWVLLVYLFLYLILWSLIHGEYSGSGSGSSSYSSSSGSFSSYSSSSSSSSSSYSGGGGSFGGGGSSGSW